MKGVIIQASARSNGHTHQLVRYLQAQTSWDIIDLKHYRIDFFEYDKFNEQDDFMVLMRQLAANYDIYLLATPIYWYTMSALLKNFLDRITDCLRWEKETGRKLRGKKMAVLSCGSDEEIKSGFHMPFKESARYLDMDYMGNIHGWIEAGEIPSSVEMELHDFARRILDSF